MKMRLSVAAGLVVASSSVLSAQQTAQVDMASVSSMTMISDTRVGPGVGIDNPFYNQTPGAGGPLANHVNLWFDRGGGQFSACTGTMLNARQLLTAAHCVSNGTSLTSSNFFARFRTGSGNGPGDWLTVQGTGYAVRDGYSGQVIEERDIAVLTLDADAPAFAGGASISQDSPFSQTRIGGYGRYGVIGGAQTFSDQFSNAARARTGFNLFESTCRTGGACLLASNPEAVVEGWGGVLLGDADLSGESSVGFLCGSLGFCTAGYGDFQEVGVNRGDSGSAAFDANGNIIGVASWGSIIDPGSRIPEGGSVGYACVANFASNQACQANYDWIQRQLVTTSVPEPGSLALLGLGFAGLAAARRRRSVA